MPVPTPDQITAAERVLRARRPVLNVVRALAIAPARPGEPGGWESPAAHAERLAGYAPYAAAFLRELLAALEDVVAARDGAPQPAPHPEADYTRAHGAAALDAFTRGQGGAPALQGSWPPVPDAARRDPAGDRRSRALVQGPGRLDA